MEVIVQIFLPDIARLLGAEGEMLTDAVLYARITLVSMPFFMLQSMFQTFFATAGKPKLGLLVTVIAGCANMVLDTLFVGIFGMGISGAAIATVVSEICGGVLPVIYFSRKNGSLLRLGKTSFSMKLLLKAASNGSSELMSNISTSIVNMLYNIQLLKYIGENGVAAYGVIMYLSLVFNAMFIGYSIGTAPIISFNYGARNSDELKNIFKKSIKLILCCGLFLLFASAFLGRPLSTIFVGYDEELLDLTVFALRIYSIAFLICGFNIFGSAFFTALNNGLISAGISFLRTLVFQIICVMLLPLIFGVNGIWFSVTIAELCAATVTVMCFIAQRKRYKYI